MATIQRQVFSFWMLVWLCFGALFSVNDGEAQEIMPILKNGNFKYWVGSAPRDWKVEIAATNGGELPVSVVRKTRDTNLELFGDSKTRGWHSVSQKVMVTPGQMYRLSFTARAKNLKLEGRQFDNCHIGLWFKNEAGKTIGNSIEWVNSDEFENYETTEIVPQQAKSMDVTIFLSKTGALHVKDVAVENLSERNSFDYLIEEMQDHYSYFEHKRIDVKKLNTLFRDRANAAKDKSQFVDVVAEMLAELKDAHAWIIKDGKPYSKFRSTFTPNFDFAVVDKRLERTTKFGQIALLGRTKDGFGYIRIVSLSGIDDKVLKRIKNSVSRMFDAPGIIVDFRRNSGGNEIVAQEIARMFADKDYVYAKQKFRTGDGFGKAHERILSAGDKPIFTKPVVCLIGPGAVSSGEGFALMFKAIEHCQTIGLPTRGASGNPAATVLPNGVEVWFSRWVAMNAGGVLIEGRGVHPDIEVTHDTNRPADPTFERAVEVLKERTQDEK